MFLSILLLVSVMALPTSMIAQTSQNSTLENMYGWYNQLPVKAGLSGGYTSCYSSDEYGKHNSLNPLYVFPATYERNQDYSKPNPQKELSGAIPGIKLQLKPVKLGQAELSAGVTVKVDGLITGNGGLSHKAAFAQIKTGTVTVKVGQLPHALTSAISSGLVNSSKGSLLVPCKAREYQVSVDTQVANGSHVITSLSTNTINSMPDLTVRVQNNASSADSFVGVGFDVRHASSTQSKQHLGLASVYAKATTEYGIFKHQMVYGLSDAQIASVDSDTKQSGVLNALDYWLDYETKGNLWGIKPGLCAGYTHVLNAPAVTTNLAQSDEVAQTTVASETSQAKQLNALVRLSPRASCKVSEQLTIGLETNWYLAQQKQAMTTSFTPLSFGAASIAANYSF